jgi:hypothetical protein
MAIPTVRARIGEHKRTESHAPDKANSLSRSGGHGAVELMLIHGQEPFS